MGIDIRQEITRNKDPLTVRTTRRKILMLNGKLELHDLLHPSSHSGDVGS